MNPQWHHSIGLVKSYPHVICFQTLNTHRFPSGPKHLCKVCEHIEHFFEFIFFGSFAMTFCHFGDWLEFSATRELSLDFSLPDQG